MLLNQECYRAVSVNVVMEPAVSSFIPVFTAIDLFGMEELYENKL